MNWVFRHLAAAGITLVSTESQPNGSPRENIKTAVERAFDIVAIFASLTEEERQTLVGKTKRKRYDKGDVLVKPGVRLGSLFIIGAGVVSVTRVSSEGEIELMRVGPGDHFGEIGLLTGDASQVTLKALTPVTTYELAKEHLTPLIAARPDFRMNSAMYSPNTKRSADWSPPTRLIKVCLQATWRTGSRIGCTGWSTSPTLNERAIRLESTRPRPGGGSH